MNPALINTEISTFVGSTDAARSFDKKILSLGPTDIAFVGGELSKGIKHLSVRYGSEDIYQKRIGKILKRPFCGYRPNICGNCHEFEGCTNKSPSICPDSPGNPVCGHHEINHFWIDLERLTVIHGLMHNDLDKAVKIHDVAMLRALMRTANQQDQKILHPHFKSGSESATKTELKKQQTETLKASDGLINRVYFRTQELLAFGNMPMRRQKKGLNEILEKFYISVENEIDAVYTNLFIQQ